MALCVEEANEKYRSGDAPLTDIEYDFFVEHTKHLTTGDAVGTGKIFNLFPDHRITHDMIDITGLLFNAAKAHHRAYDLEMHEMLDNVLTVGSKVYIPEPEPDTEVDSRISGKWYREFDTSEGFAVSTSTGRYTQGGDLIFAGDILQWTIAGTAYKGVVHYSRSYCAYVVGTTALASIVNVHNAASVKVLGNVFQHAQLLTHDLCGTTVTGSALTPSQAEVNYWLPYHA